MIVLLVTRAHRYTHRFMERDDKVAWRTLSYLRAFKSRKLPQATYIFGDLDRLGFWELELAGRLYNVLIGAGARALNNPALVYQRFGLLRRLEKDDLNGFQVWRVEDGERPDRFPVFLRCMSAHRGQLSDLLRNPEQVEHAIQAALTQGIPRKELMLIEYCAEPVTENLFRKLSIFRVGDRLITTTGVHERHWSAKNGEPGVATQALYDDEFDQIRTNRFAEHFKAVFEAAHIEYGRADFGLVKGTPQTYEINTNPTIARITQHAFPVRVEASNLYFEQFRDALNAVDTPSGGKSIPVRDSTLFWQRIRDLLMTRRQWTV